jgi:phosphoenolpyruvate carboxykinase (ATP)
MNKNTYIIDQPIIHYQENIEKLIDQTISLGLGALSDTGALCVSTGKFTGRSPENKYFVKDDITAKTIDWGGFNHPIAESVFTSLREKIKNHLNQQKEIWIRDVFACADPQYQISLRVYTELPWAALFVSNMFIGVPANELNSFKAEWTILHAPSFLANPIIDQTNASNFAIISFSHKEIIIGGSGYTGEIKKGVFSILNYLLPHNHQVLSMHCSANLGKDDDTALFFGLSGTGKTTLSADPLRKLIGDDEHGWSDHAVFNFEGGCYAKTIKLNKENEPDIFGAIQKGALLENVQFFPNTNQVNYDDASITENTRVSYPIHHIHNIAIPSVATAPKNIFFLTCDAYGVLPPISKLSSEQAMYQFISGYTAKIAGTEEGIKTPKATFSACFGAPFLPLHPNVYANLLGKKMKAHHCDVWLINTGWTGGPYGVGKRMSLKDTRAMIQAALDGSLNTIVFENFEVFNFQVPTAIAGVDSNILQPKNTWKDPSLYDKAINDLAQLFIHNFQQFEAGVSENIKAAAPVLK